MKNYIIKMIKMQYINDKKSQASWVEIVGLVNEKRSLALPRDYFSENLDVVG